MTYSKPDGTAGTIVLDETAPGYDAPYRGTSEDWTFNLTVSPTLLAMSCYTRKQHTLTGLYDQEQILYPVGANVQTAEPPLWQSKLAQQKYMREVELWTTQELTEQEVFNAVHYSMPILPGFPGSALSPEAYMNSGQVIAGRSRVYSGTTSLDAELGFGTLIHESIIGEGEPVAAPDLHYVRAYYSYAVWQFAANWIVLDVPSMRDILTVAQVSAKDDTQWMTRVVRGAAPDAR